MARMNYISNTPFNPIIDFQDKATDAEENGQKLQLALRIFNHYAIKPHYHYGSGINSLSMTLTKKES